MINVPHAGQPQCSATRTRAPARDLPDNVFLTFQRLNSPVDIVFIDHILGGSSSYVQPVTTRRLCKVINRAGRSHGLEKYACLNNVPQSIYLMYGSEMWAI